jgi:hypothetical protein
MGTSNLRWSDDDELQVALGEALQEPPRSLVEAAKGSFALWNLDAELAALSHDSVMDGELVSGARAELASLRYLRYGTRAGDFIIDLEVTPDGLVGQLWPEQPGELEVQLADGGAAPLPVDEDGGFAVRPTPSCSFRLYWRAATGRKVVTDWTPL